MTVLLALGALALLAYALLAVAAAMRSSQLSREEVEA